MNSLLIEGEVLQADPSDSANGIARDVCFDDGRATIRAKDGRAWGLNRDFVANAAGLGIAGQFSEFSNGSDQPLVDGIDSTYNVLITSKGAPRKTHFRLAEHSWRSTRPRL